MIAILGFGVEIFTTQLISIWFAVSALINLFLVSMHIGLKWQLIQFIVTGVTLLLIFRPLAKKLQPKFHPMNAADGIIGKTGTVLNDQRVKVDGQLWKYAAVEKLNTGDSVKVVALNGVTLQVQKIKGREE
ncbi:NfeD family protein [Ligilactobacillus aviarius]|uniref:NfeD-like C-terminal domain-containing protein n=1 Tax=Ligilactobacillus aviarius TaxID=1606 RepID=A0A510WSG0_9LACO|nr:NfeD family protein [Ligilactobacillus aviarius]KRM40019.1 hypothetical protein FC33_GL001224 [Ligilactobacillus aviarius subsp. aviarius DSM 20655]GEK41527.1 hypothetical protein LAV01_03590 [Ligilactobacillus aviarius]